jgi:hypothetical protein
MRTKVDEFNWATLFLFLPELDYGSCCLLLLSFRLIRYVAISSLDIMLSLQQARRSSMHLL